MTFCKYPSEVLHLCGKCPLNLKIYIIFFILKSDLSFIFFRKWEDAPIWRKKVKLNLSLKVHYVLYCVCHALVFHLTGVVVLCYVDFNIIRPWYMVNVWSFQGTYMVVYRQNLTNMLNNSIWNTSFWLTK